MITDMRSNDWKTAEKHAQIARQKDYLREAAYIQRAYFHESTDLGIVRLKENEEYGANRQTYDGYMSDVLGDLEELFGDIEPLEKQEADT